MITLYGISNCDTMRKARAWLEEHRIEYRFHDYKKAGIDDSSLRAWVEELGWEARHSDLQTILESTWRAYQANYPDA